MLIINNDSTYEVKNSIIAFTRTYANGDRAWYSFVDSGRTKISLATQRDNEIHWLYNYYVENFDNIESYLNDGNHVGKRGVSWHGEVKEGKSKAHPTYDSNIEEINNEDDLKNWIEKFIMKRNMQ